MFRQVKRKRTSSISSRKRARAVRRSRRRKNSKKRLYTVRTSMPVADRTITRLKYSEMVNFALSTVAGTVTAYSFRSSLYDPDLTGTGHQPLWRDQVALMYQRYRVTNVRYRFSIYNENVTGASMVSGMIRHSPNATTDTSYQTIRERQGTRNFVLGSWTSAPKIIKGNMNVAKVHGLTRTDYIGDEDFEADIDANPVKAGYIHVYLTNHVTGITHQLKCLVDLIFNVEFFQRKEVGGS